MVLILCKVGATEKKIRQYGQGTQRGMIRTRQTGRQALMYIGAFFFWFFPFVPVNRLQADAEYGDTKYFISLLALRTISPLQGFFNALIYRRRMGGAETRRSTISNIRQSSLASTSRISKLFSRKSEASASLDSPAHGLSEASSNMISQRNDSAHSVNLTAESIDELEEDDEEKVGSIASENNKSEIVQDQDYGETSHDLDAKEDNQPSNPETMEPNRETSGRHSRVDMTGSIDERVNN
ncbi:unnamed protein product [Cylindrotheca closterium]|nr:unnamed protein product [Cylindrotheca closterium]